MNIKNKYKSIWLIMFIFAAPSIFIGAMAMKVNDVPKLFYLQNIIFFFVGWIVSCIFLYNNFKLKNRSGIVALIIILLGYVLSFIDPGIDGVHRWVSIGPISLHLSSILLPILFIVLSKLLEDGKETLSIIIALLVAIFIVLQPDAAQLTAFGIPMIAILFSKVEKKSYLLPQCLCFLY